MKLHTIRDHGFLLRSPSELQGRWNKLARESETDTVFQTFEWHRCWWEAFGDGRELLVVVAEERGEWVGLAPLMITTRRVNGVRERILGFIGADNMASDFADLIVRKQRTDAVRALLAWISDNRQLWTQVDLINVPGESAHYEQLVKGLEQLPRTYLDITTYDAPTRVLGNEVEDRATLNKKSLKRHFNYFQKSGTLNFRHVATVEEALSFLGQFFSQHIERRALVGDTSMFHSPDQRTFYELIIKVLLPIDLLRFAVVEYDGKPIAFHLGFEYAARYIWYKPTFDVALTKKSPGEVLLRYLLEYALERRLSEFDFTVGDEAFKYRFATRVRQMHRVRLYTSVISYCLMRTRRRLGVVRQQWREGSRVRSGVPRLTAEPSEDN